MSALAVGVAAALDAVLREPPLALHPVRAVGRYLDAAARWVPAGPPGPAMLAGAAVWSAGAAAATLAGAAVERLPRPAVTGLALWPLFAQRLLLDEVASVEAALAGSLDAGRAAVGRIVSRDTGALTATEVRQAAIESLGENLSDSVVAPLLWYAAGGLPAAALYRFANTADAAWGYRTARWRYAGRVAARADDLLNLVPARVTGLLLAGRHVPLSTLRREARRTASPNAGWPMAALALRLGIRLVKPAHYDLNPGGRPPTPTDTAAALRLTERTGWACIAAAAALAETRAGATRRRQPWPP